MGTNYQTKSKKKLIALRIISKIDKDENCRLKARNTELDEEKQKMKEAYGRACQETARVIGYDLSRKQTQIDLLEKDKTATGLKMQDYKAAVAKLKLEKRQLVDHVIILDAEIKLGDELNEQSQTAKEELAKRVAVLQSSLHIAALQKKTTLLLVEEQSQTIAEF
jgi:hypothetical protein